MPVGTATNVSRVPGGVIAHQMSINEMPSHSHTLRGSSGVRENLKKKKQQKNRSIFFTVFETTVVKLAKIVFIFFCFLFLSPISRKFPCCLLQQIKITNTRVAENCRELIIIVSRLQGSGFDYISMSATICSPAAASLNSMSADSLSLNGTSAPFSLLPPIAVVKFIICVRNGGCGPVYVFCDVTFGKKLKVEQAKKLKK